MVTTRRSIFSILAKNRGPVVGAPGSAPLKSRTKDHGGDSMKTLVVIAVGLALTLSAHVAAAYVAVVGTAIPIASAPDAAEPANLEKVVRSAIRDVLEHAVAFTPTVVTIQDARIIGDRLYLFIFVSDEGGESGVNPPTRDQRPGSRRDDEGSSDPPAEAPEQQDSGWL
jgi:hypothetical protein